MREDADDVDFVNRFQASKREGHVRMHREAKLVALVRRHGFEPLERFASAIAFTRERNAEYDELLAETPEPVLRACRVKAGEREITLRFRIPNVLFVGRRRHSAR